MYLKAAWRGPTWVENAPLRRGKGVDAGRGRERCTWRSLYWGLPCSTLASCLWEELLEGWEGFQILSWIVSNCEHGFCWYLLECICIDFEMKNISKLRHGVSLQIHKKVFVFDTRTQKLTTALLLSSTYWRLHVTHIVLKIVHHRLYIISYSNSIIILP